MTSLSIKAIKVTTDLLKFEAAVNDFGKEHNVKATQTHVTVAGDQLIYHAIIFYQEV